MPNLDYDNLATKADLENVRVELRGEIGGLRVKLKEDITTLKAEMTANLRIMLLGQVGTAIALGGLIVRLA